MHLSPLETDSSNTANNLYSLFEEANPLVAWINIKALSELSHSARQLSIEA